MCCFSRSVASVHDTRIFARKTAENRQALVYQMRYQAEEELAMVLPIPTRPSAGEKAMRFISLEKYPAFFKDMRTAFPDPAARSAGDSFGGSPTGPRLSVKEVGSFEASFVPTTADFSRLDPRFRLPEGTWEKLPDYRNFGFAIFKLKADAENVHPMAFEFITALPGALFFPTVHIHDGEIHEQAGFDHELYLQGGLPRKQTELRDEKTKESKPLRWQESEGIPVQFMKAGRTGGTIDPGSHIHRLVLKGTLLNRDFLVA